MAMRKWLCWCAVNEMVNSCNSCVLLAEVNDDGNAFANDDELDDDDEEDELDDEDDEDELDDDDDELDDDELLDDEEDELDDDDEPIA